MVTTPITLIMHPMDTTSKSPMLTIRLFGRFRIQHKGEPIQGLDHRKAQELFAYLLLHRGREHSREDLANMLWSYTATTATTDAASPSRAYLRKALWQLQAALKPYTQLAKHTEEYIDEQPDKHIDAQNNNIELLSAAPDWVKFNLHGPNGPNRPNGNGHNEHGYGHGHDGVSSNNNAIWIDVAQFEDAAISVHWVRGEQLSDQQAHALQEAIALYGDGLLAGWNQAWCFPERARFQQMQVEMLDKLIDYCEACDEYEAAIDCGKQLLACEPTRERTHHRLMMLHCLNDDRTAALRQYEQYTSCLTKEFNATPSRSVRSLYEQIRDDQHTELSIRSSRRAAVTTSSLGADASLISPTSSLSPLSPLSPLPSASTQSIGQAPAHD